MVDVASLAHELRLGVHRMTRRVRQQHATEGLTLSQMSALAIIWREGEITAGALAAREQVRPPSITRVLDHLERAGVVDRRDNPADKRQVLVRVTDEGARRMTTYVQAREAWLVGQLADLSADDQDTLRRAAAIIDDLAAS